MEESFGTLIRHVEILEEKVELLQKLTKAQNYLLVSLVRKELPGECQGEIEGGKHDSWSQDYINAVNEANGYLKELENKPSKED